MTLQERLRAASPFDYTLLAMCDEAADELDRLARENEALRKDAERYRTKRYIDAGRYVRTREYMDNDVSTRDGLIAAWFTSYDAAIDAAMKEQT